MEVGEGKRGKEELVVSWYEVGKERYAEKESCQFEE